jgi:hypothetical protein
MLATSQITSMRRPWLPSPGEAVVSTLANAYTTFR